MNRNNKKILITGAEVYWFHLVKKMTSLGFKVVGIDNLNQNYDKK